MLNNEKGTFTKIKKKYHRLCHIIKKIDFNESIEEKEKVYILSVAIIFLESYYSDKKNISYADFSYYLILKYTILTGDYEPLYNFSVNFGFYPIVNEIFKQHDNNNYNLFDGMVKTALNNYKNEKEKYIETREQNILSKRLLEDTSYEKSYIAPTSFGKSSIISEVIKKFDNSIKKIAIIVPSKSLLVQTYKNIIKSNLNKKIILHDGMYDNEDEFIAILTQERALKMIDIHGICFDTLIIDEAHNIFDGEERSILLTRLIKKNYSCNNHQYVYYFSPLIKDVENLRINHHINLYNVSFNIKEPILYEYKQETKEIYLFNRFLCDFWNTGNTSISWIDYIISQDGEKNLYTNQHLRR